VPELAPRTNPNAKRSRVSGISRTQINLNRAPGHDQNIRDMIAVHIRHQCGEGADAFKRALQSLLESESAHAVPKIDVRWLGIDIGVVYNQVQVPVPVQIGQNRLKCIPTKVRWQPRPAASRSKTRIASASLSRSARNSASILLISILAG
jgi:hypothetical protein